MRKSNIKKTKEKNFDMEIYNPIVITCSFSRITVDLIQIYRETQQFSLRPL